MKAGASQVTPEKRPMRSVTERLAQPGLGGVRVFRVWSPPAWVPGLGFRVPGFGLRVPSLGCGVFGLGFRVFRLGLYGLGLPRA